MIDENVGRIITDFYCNGFFGRTYDMSGSEIIAESADWIVIRTCDGEPRFADFGGWPKQELIDGWCKQEEV